MVFFTISWGGNPGCILRMLKKSLPEVSKSSQGGQMEGAGEVTYSGDRMTGTMSMVI
jgi:hypothetical protein